MKREVHKIYDAILKVIIIVYLIEFLRYIGEERDIVEVLKSDITTLNGSTKYLDYLCRLKDGTLCHVEFEFPVAYETDLERFFRYNILAEIRFDGIAETIIFNFSTSAKGCEELHIGYSKDFHPKVFYLGDIDFEKELEKIYLKLNLARLENLINPNRLNIQLTYREELHIMLMSLAEKYTDKKVFLKQAVKLLKNEKLFHEEKIDIIKSIIRLEIDNFLTEEEKRDFKRTIKMTDETLEIFKEAFEFVNKKYEQEAIDEARAEGVKEGKKEGREEGLNLPDLLEVGDSQT